LDELTFLIQGHVADIVTEVALSADMAGLSIAVTGLCKGFEGPSVVNVHQDAGRECA
jgi:hypothetical protein